MPGTAPSRNLTTLTSLQLASAAAGATVAQPQPSTAVKLTGNVAHPGSYNLAQLQALPVTQETVSGDNYTGVALWTFLASKATPVTDQIVVTRGTDNYEVVLSLAELDPALGGNPLNLLPYADTGTDFPTDGVARTIFPDDNKHGRWISNLDLVDVEAVPEPGTFALFAIAAASLVIAKRRKLPPQRTCDRWTPDPASRHCSPMTDAPDNDLRPGEVAIELPAATDAGVYFIGTIRTPWRMRGDCPKRGSARRTDLQASSSIRAGATRLTDIGNHKQIQVMYWMHQCAP